MIVIVKGKDYKRIAIKAISYIIIVIMFYFYYQHMSDKFKDQNKQLVTKLNISVEKKQDKKTKKLEDTIYNEALVIVNLVKQKHVQSIKIVNNRLLMVCDFDTNIEPLMIRYGINALIQSTSKNIKLAIKLKTIVENKYEK